MDDSNKIDLDIEKVVEESKAKKLKKYEEAKILVQEAKSIVNESDNELQDCKLLLEKDIHEYIEAVNGLKEGGLDESRSLLSNLRDIEIENMEIEKENTIFEEKEELKPLVLKDVSSGKFTGFLLSLLGGVATFGGLVYWATEKLGMTLDVSKVPTNETIETIFSWFGTQVGQKEDAMVGAIAVAAVVLITMALIYAIRVAIKSSTNLHFAKKQMKETQKYITQKSNCKAEMDRVDAHVKESVKLLKDYEILLNEQAGKLKRIFYFENKKTKSSDFQGNSIHTIKESKELIENIQKFIATPMLEEGKLSEWKVNTLVSAKEHIQKVLKSY